MPCKAHTVVTGLETCAFSNGNDVDISVTGSTQGAGGESSYDVYARLYRTTSTGSGVIATREGWVSGSSWFTRKITNVMKSSTATLHLEVDLYHRNTNIFVERVKTSSWYHK